MGKRSVGRRAKTEADAFRAASFYFAAAEAARLEFDIEVTPAFLHRLFSPEGNPQNKGAGPWYRYRDGTSLPGRGTYKSRDTNIVRDVGARYPAVPTWLTKPLWAISETVEITIPQIHALMLELEPSVQCILISKMEDGTFIRWNSNRQFEVDAMVDRGTLDSLAAVIALLREADLNQSYNDHKIAFEGMCALLHTLEQAPATAPLAQAFATYAKRLFEPMWILVPGIYNQHPSVTDAIYRGALKIPKIDKLK